MPAYVLNVARFEGLLEDRKLTKTQFIEQTGIPRRTLANVLVRDRELTGRTIRYFLDFFPRENFESLFDSTTEHTSIAA